MSDQRMPRLSPFVALKGTIEHIFGIGGQVRLRTVCVPAAGESYRVEELKVKVAPTLDRIDRAILRELQVDGRLPNNVLAERVGLSPSPCLRRVRLLEDAGIIKRYVALVDAAKVGLGMTIFARIRLVAQDAATTAGFIAAVETLPEVVECQLIAGDCDFVLRIVTADLEAYRKFQMNHLGQVKGVQSIKTEIPMQTVKLTSAIPL